MPLLFAQYCSVCYEHAAAYGSNDIKRFTLGATTVAATPATITTVATSTATSAPLTGLTTNWTYYYRASTSTPTAIGGAILPFKPSATNTPPIDVVCSPTSYVPPSTANNSVCTLTAIDIDAGQTITFSIVGGANAGLFALSGGTQLQIVAAGQTGTPLVVTVRATDNGTPVGLVDKTFSITSCVDVGTGHLTVRPCV